MGAAWSHCGTSQDQAPHRDRRARAVDETRALNLDGTAVGIGGGEDQLNRPMGSLGRIPIGLSLKGIHGEF